MRLPTGRVCVWLAPVLLLVAAPVQASPVTIDYVVSQIQLCYYHDQSNLSAPPPTCSSPSDMTLTLTYDDGITTTESSPGLAFTHIETVPTFTLSGPAPLANPFGPPESTDAQVFGAQGEGTGFRTDNARASLNSRYEHFSIAGTIFTRHFWSVGFDLYAERTIFGPQDEIVDFPTTADIEARLRGAFGPLSFQFASIASSYTCDIPTDCAIYYDDIAEGSFLLSGVATPVAAAAVPEPASLLLLGSGLTGAIVRRRRQVGH